MKKLFNEKAAKLFVLFYMLIFSESSILAQTPNVAQIEEPKTGMEILLFFGLLLFMILAPAFKKREWPRLRKGYNYPLQKN
ncbi:MAG: hypothetical protein JWQ09_3368 [Segetibacter sp.]|nr:hypothetical protein [Segetibacter sp.]